MQGRQKKLHLTRTPFDQRGVIFSGLKVTNYPETTCLKCLHMNLTQVSRFMLISPDIENHMLKRKPNQEMIIH